MPGFSTDTDVGVIRKELSHWLPRTELCELGYLDGYRPVGRLR